MSKPRIIRAVRCNPDFIVTTRELDRLGIAWELCPPMGRGHPFLRVGPGGHVRVTIGTSPKGRLQEGVVLGNLRRRLKEAGLIPGKEER